MTTVDEFGNIIDVPDPTPPADTSSPPAANPMQVDPATAAAGAPSTPAEVPNLNSNVGQDPYNPLSYTGAGYIPAANPMQQDHAQTMAALEAAKNDAPNDTINNLLAKFSDLGKWTNKNPLLAYGVLSGLAGAQKGEQARQAAAQAQTDKIATLDHEAQIARDKIAANSASVSGLRPVNGIIASELKRINGDQVFQPNGRIA